VPLFALARANLALKRPEAAEPLLREALAVRTPGYPASDPRVLEVKVALVNALEMLGRVNEQRKLRAEIEPQLKASSSPYAADLRGRLRSTAGSLQKETTS
jgi:serine/threonine-protein kinase